MLAAHRDQENLVLSHQVPTKQAPKTPGSRYPKTPSGLGRRDENAPGAFGGKGTVGDGKAFVKALGAHHNAVTPMAPQNRAVLGDKTTNAKARTGQGRTGGPEGFDKSQARPSSVRRQRQKPAGSRKLFRPAQRDVEPDHDEPEYAPPRPKELPYQSDVLPKGGLSFDGIQPQNLFKGFYQHFHDPADDRGVTRLDRILGEEMAAVLEDAIQRNKEETDRLGWNGADVDREEADRPGSRLGGAASQRRVPSVSSRHAAAALAAQPCGASDEAADSASNGPFGTSVGEAASRTSIGYTKGRSTSSVLHQHQREEASRERPSRVKRIVPIIDRDGDPTIVSDGELLEEEEEEEEEAPRPAFVSIFDGHADDLELELELPAMPVPFESDEEEFEMRLDD